MLALFFLGACATDSAAKAWRGIIPLHSTREDVVWILNQCRSSDPSCEFTVDEGFVHIEFSGSAAGELHQCERGLHPETVLLIEVSPKAPSTMKKVGLNKRDFRTVELLQGTKGYVDDKSGLVLKMYEEKIVQLDYIAALAERSLCPSYYASPESFVQEIFLSHVPVIYVTCPSSRARPGETVTISADLARQPKISFLWRVSAGQILAGQGTRAIKLDTTGLAGQTIVATVRLGRVAASCEVQVAPK